MIFKPNRKSPSQPRPCPNAIESNSSLHTNCTNMSKRGNQKYGDNKRLCLLHCELLLGFFFVGRSRSVQVIPTETGVFLSVHELHFKTLVGNALRCCQISAKQIFLCFHWFSANDFGSTYRKPNKNKRYSSDCTGI